MIPLLAQAGIAGNSPAMEQIATLIGQVADTDLSVLITGESGSGKELIARAIHDNSRRRKHRLVTVNCGAIPEGIFESEVFGHERGAFTGAERLRKGMFELADGGTIFLDEIGEMPLMTQVKILRVLETGEFMRVGGQTPLQVDVRVVAATNRDLAREVSRGQFRQDLYFRLKAISVQLPPLRERREDIPELVEYFARRFAESNDRGHVHFTPAAMEVLKDHYWQGNVRELKNFVESLLILSRGDVDEQQVRGRLDLEGSSANLPALSQAPVDEPELNLDLLRQMFFYLQHELSEIRQLLTEMHEEQRQVQQPLDLSSLTVDELEKEHIQEVLLEHGGNRARAAHALGLSERTLYRKIRKYGL